jgi:hypothetical protein
VIGRRDEGMAVLVRTKKQAEAELKIVSGKHNGKTRLSNSGRHHERKQSSSTGVLTEGFQVVGQKLVPQLDFTIIPTPCLQDSILNLQ